MQQVAAPARIRVAIEHAEPLVALGLSAALSQQSDFDLVDSRGGSQIVVADYVRGLQLAVEARHRPRGVWQARVLIVTSQEREHEVRRALEAGVDGYLAQGCEVPEFLCGLRQLARGSRYLSATAARRIADSMARSALTQREQQVLALVVRGKGNKAIALALEVSLGTIKAHMKGLMGKLGAATRTEAANIAVERGLVRLES
ncbi:response regulator transcription factor [Roseateles sp. DAIF2]|uniref:response regulator transcription factor n=1 Tax=Roseateles sp. DAIF2 TaxID=2714952 RepID=UPI0018A2C591|nr:response regulator transcription factor [Roseateles sp. DAIF2]QPF74041.1 response regulator transcription factor [Roseateles sp. DAIF2]